MTNGRVPYTFAVLRYTHDVVTGEFVNVGVVLYAPALRYLRAKCTNAYGRLSKFFGHVEGDPFRQVMRRIEHAVSLLDERVFEHIQFGDLPRDAMACAAQVLPPDDSSLSFVAGGAGMLVSAPEQAVEQLFERYVERYAKQDRAEGRTDQEVWSAFRKPLQVSARPKRQSKRAKRGRKPVLWVVEWRKPGGAWKVSNLARNKAVARQSAAEQGRDFTYYEFRIVAYVRRSR